MAFDVWKIVNPAALRVVHDHVMGAPHTEVGGFLIGTHGAPHEPPVVQAAVEAHDAEGDLTHLTFTHAAWEHVHRVLDSDYPDSSIIGWYHSHPGHGIFLSEHDKFIQRNFFSAPWQIAIVVDPHARTEGFFAWTREDIVLISQRDVGADAFAPTTPAARAAFQRRQVVRPDRPARLVVTFDDALAHASPPPASPATPATPAPAAPPRSTPPPAAPAPAAPSPPAPERAARPAAERYPLAGHVLPAAAGLVIGILLAIAL